VPQESGAEVINDAPSMDIDSTPANYKEKSLDEILTIAEERSPNGGNIDDPNSTRVLSQVLGFKFAYYQVRCFTYCEIKLRPICVPF
jgi:THO complex subunit 2